MKATELIEKLTKLIDLHGNQVVLVGEFELSLATAVEYIEDKAAFHITIDK